MALQWMLLGVVAATEALLALLLTFPYPPALRHRIVDMVSALLQPAIGIIPFSLFQLLDIYWKNEHRLKCASDGCTALDRDRYERSIYKAQRNVLLGVGACLLYWLLARMCKYYHDMHKLENDVKRLKED